MADILPALIASTVAAEDAESASRAFFDAVAPLGATYLQTRVYYRPSGPLTSSAHWKAAGFVARYAPESWPGSSAFHYVCFDCNPLLEPVRRGMTRWRFSDFAPRGSRGFSAYWDALSEAAIGEGYGSVAYGAGRRIANVHLGFERPPPDSTAGAAHLAGLILAERLLEVDRTLSDQDEPRLTARERDCLTFVAEGKSDWEISVILGVSEATARFHVDNARAKLGAVNRAHAVARFAASGGL